MKFATTLVSLALALALGVLSAQTVLAGAAPPAADPGTFMGDFNGDGRQDVLIANGATRDLYVYVTAAGIAPGGTNVDLAESGLIATLPVGASVTAVSDFNNDTRADILVATAAGGLSVLVNDAAVPPGNPVALVAGAGLYAAPPVEFSALAAADADADGKVTVEEFTAWYMDKYVKKKK